MLDLINSIYNSQVLPEHNELYELLDSCISCLENENSVYRPQMTEDGQKAPGGLLDFTSVSDEVPVIVVPDLHARQKFIVDLLKYEIAGMTVLQALEEKKVCIVCVGDLFHSESRCAARWRVALEKFDKGEIESDEMTAEMVECIGLLQMVMILKTQFPENFHILKGNHENVLNSSNNGNHPFYKFADEANMVYEFLASHYDDLIIQEIDWFESKLPVCAAFKNLVVSHAEPAREFSKKEIINYHDTYEAVYGLTWTRNDFAESGSVEKTMKALIGNKNKKNAVWISGHRPVYEKYALRQGGKLVQIHNPNEENVAIVIPQTIFNPDTDIFCVE